MTIRNDGVYIEEGDVYLDILVNTLKSAGNTLAIFRYSYFETHKSKVGTVPINGIEPTYEAITRGSYAGARKLYVYVQKQHIGLIPYLDQIPKEYLSASALGENGYLLNRVLLPLRESDFITALAAANNMTLLTPEALEK
jgi:phosphate transport system substrate-binding protein